MVRIIPGLSVALPAPAGNSYNADRIGYSSIARPAEVIGPTDNRLPLHTLRQAAFLFYRVRNWMTGAARNSR